MNDFRARFNQALAGKGISRRELARLSGVHVNTLNNWAGGDVPNPHPRQVQKVAPFLGVSYEWLRAGVEPAREAGGVSESREAYTHEGEIPFDLHLMEQVVRLVEDYARLYRKRLDEAQRVELMEKAYQRCLAAGLTGRHRISMSQFQELLRGI